LSESSLEPDFVTAATLEADAVAMLHELNANHIRAFVEADTAWYSEHLSADFVCTLADGRRIDKAEFLQRNAKKPGVTNVTYDQIDVRLLGDVALVHGVTHYLRDGSPASTRYTDVWSAREGRWQAVAAQLTSVTQ
jgi:ketosteroid isomerase-like protein